MCNQRTSIKSSPCPSSTSTPQAHVSASCSGTLSLTAHVENIQDILSSVLAASMCQQSHVSGITSLMRLNETYIVSTTVNIEIQQSKSYFELNRVPALSGPPAPCIPRAGRPTGHNVVSTNSTQERKTNQQKRPGLLQTSPTCRDSKPCLTAQILATTAIIRSPSQSHPKHQLNLALKGKHPRDRRRGRAREAPDSINHNDI